MYLKFVACRTCRLLLRNYYHLGIRRANIYTNENKLVNVTRSLNRDKNVVKGIQSKYDYARRLFVSNILKRVTNSLAADLRRRTARNLFNGNPSPFFALVGVSLASGTGIITKDDQLEGICWEIRESMRRIRYRLIEAENYEFNSPLSLENFEFGKVIAKGCNAVVYEAREKPKVDEAIASENDDNYPLAVKMMFNYDVESNAICILRSMYKEMVPLRTKPDINFLDENLEERIQKLPPHPNIVEMYHSFTDYIPDLQDSHSLYPYALPPRINPDGYGRNMSLFLIMKRYKTNLREYLSGKIPNTRDAILLFTQLLEAVAHINKYEIAHRDLKSDNVLLDNTDCDDECPTLVVTDFGCCLSDKYYGLTMPYRYPDLNKGGNAALMAPEVATTQPGLFSSIDYSKSDLWTVGTLAYELFTGRNPFYGMKSNDKCLKNTTYKEDMLPELPCEVPSIMAQLVYAILERNTTKRPDVELAATICQLYLWAPNQWVSTDTKLPQSDEILQWLLSLSTKVLYDRGGFINNNNKKCNRRSPTEYQIIITFLQRVKLCVIKRALIWIQDNC